MSKTNNLSSQTSQGNPETWITAAEASSILHLSLRTVISRASSGKLPARIPNDAPFTCDGMQNYLIHLEALPQKAQLEYLRNHLPPSQSCGLDLTTPRSSNGDVWLYQFLDVARIIQDAANIRNMYQHTGRRLPRKKQHSNSLIIRADSQWSARIILLFLAVFKGGTPDSQRDSCFSFFAGRDTYLAAFIVSWSHKLQN